MEYYGIASPKVAWNAIAPIFIVIFVLFATVMTFGWNAGAFWLIPFPVLAILCVSIALCKNAFCPFAMGDGGIKTPYLSLNWQDVTNIQLVHTERHSGYVRFRKYKTTSICIGETVYGDILSQSLKKCIIIPYSHKNMERMRKLAGGKNIIIDNFLSAYLNVDT